MIGAGGGSRTRTAPLPAKRGDWRSNIGVSYRSQTGWQACVRQRYVVPFSCLVAAAKWKLVASLLSLFAITRNTSDLQGIDDISHELDSDRSHLYIVLFNDEEVAYIIHLACSHARRRGWRGRA